MHPEDDDDLPYGENFHDPVEAAAWADAALRKRPWRTTLFERFASLVCVSGRPGLRMLELGSGPGFLAEHILDHCPHVVEYTLLDFARPMLALSEARLARHGARTRFVQADFKREGWWDAVAHPIDVIVSLQAVHELRHKRHAPRLYGQLRALLSPGAEFIVCDHLPEGAHTPRHRRLYQTEAESRAALHAAGFAEVEVVFTGHDMAMYRAVA